MNVPASIQHLLDSHNVNYTMTESLPSILADVKTITQNQQGHATRAYVLSNTQGDRLLTIIGNQTILDLEAVCEVMGDTYTPMQEEKLYAFIKSLGLTSIAAMPNLGGLPTLVDRQLLEHDTLLLSLGVDQQYIQVDRHAFQQLVETTTVSDIAIPLERINTTIPVEQDHSCIETSVERFTQRRITQRLEDAMEFPPLPIIAQRIVKLRADPHADISDLCEIVEIDPALAAQVVSWASSSYYSAPGSVKSIHDAIVRVLGFDMVLNLALGLSLGNNLKMPKQHPDGCLPYWQQSVYVAACTEALITRMPRELRPGYGSAYLSGLLHNFGYLIMAEVFNAQFKTLCQYIESNPHASTQAIEQHLIGVDRNQLACWLMTLWNMPEEVCIALRQQNNPDYSGEHWQYPLLIFIGKKLLREQGLLTGASEDPIADSVFERLQLSRQEAVEAIRGILEAEESLQVIVKQISNP